MKSNKGRKAKKSKKSRNGGKGKQGGRLIQGRQLITYFGNHCEYVDLCKLKENSGCVDGNKILQYLVHVCFSFYNIATLF